MINKTLLSYLLIIGIAATTGTIGGFVGKRLLGGVDEIIIGDPEANQADAKALLAEYLANPSKNFSASELVNIGLEKFRTQENCYSYGVGVGETVVSQQIHSYQIKNGDQYFEESISRSSMVAVASRVTQAGIEGKIKLYKGKATSDVTGTYPSEPKVYEQSDYKKTYGKTLDRMFIYILSDATVIKDKCSIDKSEDEIKVTLALDPDLSTPNYKYQMKSVGGLDNLPTFKSLTHTYTFDKDMNLKGYVVNEYYQATMMMTVDIHNYIEYKCFPGEYLKIPELTEKLDYEL